MTPGARIAAAMDILGDMSEGMAAEQALTRWARRSRFAGSKDRAAIRDHVFDLLRQRRSAAHFGKGDSPRALMIGLLHQQGADLDALFNEQGHAPEPLSPEEAEFPPPPTEEGVLWNLPGWLLPDFTASLGDAAPEVAMALQDRAPVFLRVNTRKTTRDAARATLAQEGVSTEANSLCDTALTVTDGARALRNTQAYRDGLVELQDAASQAVVAALPVGGRVLDYCAGGGGKALALAASPDNRVFAHDIDPRRMSDIPPRAERAGVDITVLDGESIRKAAPFDLVLCDAPCSGSGAWRRAPEGKWTLTPERLVALTEIQDSVLEAAASLVDTGGILAYATCSVLKTENESRVAAFLDRHPDWRCTAMQRFEVGPEGDGFFFAHLMR